jgi:purine catabolism regulatory family protein/PucR-like helix-turn-helix protein/diguanylate cyclase with GGDEF domain
MRLFELVALPALHTRVLAGAHLLDREIGWPHITEVPDPTPYLTGGELVLTAGLWNDGAASCQRFIAALCALHASGIVFGITPPHSMRTPLELIAACEHAELPLLEVPPPVPFEAICKAIAAETADRQQAPLRTAIRRNEQLVTAAGRYGRAGLMRVLAKERGLAPFLVDRHGQLLFAAPPDPTPAVVRAAVELIRASGPRVAEIEPEPGRYWVAFAVTAIQRGDQRLVCRVSLAELSAEQHTAIDQTVAFLELDAARSQVLRSTEARFATELLDMVRAGERRAEEARARLASFGVASDGPVVVLCVRPGGHALEPAVVPERLRAALEARGLSVVVAQEGELTTVFAALPTNAAAAPTLAREMLDELDADGMSLHIGVGRTVVGVDNLRRSLLEAQHACTLAGRRASGSSVASHHDIGSHQFLWELHDEEVRRDFRTALVGPLLEHDARRGSALVPTLTAYLASAGQWQATAQALSIHVNTLRYRLRRVEELTGRSLSHMGDRVDFFLALRNGD